MEVHTVQTIEEEESIFELQPPYHFGWKHEQDGGGTWQSIDIANMKHDHVIYKEDKPMAYIKSIYPD